MSEINRNSISLGREVVLASLGILVVLTLLKHAQGAVPVIGDHAGTIALAIQLYVPILLVGYAGITRQGLGLSKDGLVGDFLLGCSFALVTVIPFVIGHHLWQTQINGRVFHLGFPHQFAYSILVQFLAVALPEELFFRGYLLQRMSLLWATSFEEIRNRNLLVGLLMASKSRPVLMCSAVFAVAHFAGEYRPDRLATFFPALVFSFLRIKTGRLTAPITYHALCNLMSELVFASYRATPNS